MKRCHACDNEKPRSSFSVMRASRDGLQPKCKSCERTYNAKRYAADPAAACARTRSWRIRNLKRDNVKRKARRNGPLRSLIRAIKDAELARGCADCGERDFRVLDFDHVRGEKAYNVGAMRDVSTTLLYAEIDKCEVRCANCHRRKTYERRREMVTNAA